MVLPGLGAGWPRHYTPNRSRARLPGWSRWRAEQVTVAEPEPPWIPALRFRFAEEKVALPFGVLLIQAPVLLLGPGMG